MPNPANFPPPVMLGDDGESWSASAGQRPVRCCEPPYPFDLPKSRQYQRNPSWLRAERASSATVRVLKDFEKPCSSLRSGFVSSARSRCRAPTARLSPSFPSALAVSWRTNPSAWRVISISAGTAPRSPMLPRALTRQESFPQEQAVVLGQADSVPPLKGPECRLGKRRVQAEPMLFRAETGQAPPADLVELRQDTLNYIGRCDYGLVAFCSWANGSASFQLDACNLLRPRARRPRCRRTGRTTGPESGLDGEPPGSAAAPSAL
jgi:hypothetical protein